MKNFAAYTVALDLVRSLVPIVERLRGHSSELAKQLETAASSIVLNIAEGARRSGRNPRRFYVMANGSANEVRAVLDFAEAFGWGGEDRDARAFLDRELGLLWGLTHDRKRSRVA